MADPVTTPTPTPAQTFQTVFSVPDVWTVDHWQTYINAIQDYTELTEKQSKTPNGFIGNYHGALALVKAGVVHIFGAEKLKQFVNSDDHSLDPLPVVSAFVTYISRPIERAVNVPLPISLAQWLDGTPTPPGTASPAP